MGGKTSPAVEVRSKRFFRSALKCFPTKLFEQPDIIRISSDPRQASKHSPPTPRRHTYFIHHGSTNPALPFWEQTPALLQHRRLPSTVRPNKMPSCSAHCRQKARPIAIDPKTNSHRSARDSKPLEVLGTYNPLPLKPTGLSDAEAKSARPFKDIALDRSRTKYWLGVGAQPSETAWRLLSLVRFFFFFFLNHSRELKAERKEKRSFCDLAKAESNWLNLFKLQIGLVEAKPGLKRPQQPSPAKSTE